MTGSVLFFVILRCAATAFAAAASVLYPHGHAIIQIVVIRGRLRRRTLNLLTLSKTVFAAFLGELHALVLFLLVVPLVELGAHDACIALHGQPAALNVIPILRVEATHGVFDAPTDSTQLISEAILADSIWVRSVQQVLGARTFSRVVVLMSRLFTPVLEFTLDRI